MLFLNSLAIGLVCVVVHDETATVPLKSIWALKMPGTQDIRQLDPPKDANADTVISKVNEILTIRSSTGPKSGPCFLVVGEGKQALYKAIEVLERGEDIPRTMPSGRPLSLFFYSQFAPGYVHLDSVERSGTRLNLNYRIVVHQAAEATIHFALIPLGSLLEGRFHVDINEIKPPTPYSNQAKADRAVCDPCTFIIKKEEVP